VTEQHQEPLVKMTISVCGDFLSAAEDVRFIPPEDFLAEVAERIRRVEPGASLSRWPEIEKCDLTVEGRIGVVEDAVRQIFFRVGAVRISPESPPNHVTLEVTGSLRDALDQARSTGIKLGNL
jgi:hypothetical protein